MMPNGERGNIDQELYDLLKNRKDFYFKTHEVIFKGNFIFFKDGRMLLWDDIYKCISPLIVPPSYFEQLGPAPQEKKDVLSIPDQT